MARISPVKSSQVAAANFAKNGGAPDAANNWATNFTADIPSILAAAAEAVGRWQDAVSTDQARSNFVSGLNRAKSNVAAIATKVMGVGKSSFSAGIKAAGAPNGNYSLFSAKWQPAVAAQVQTLNMTNPRGTRADNRSRQAAYDAWVDTQANNFRVK